MVREYDPQIVDLADQLRKASKSGEGIGPLVNKKKDLTIEKAYSVQLYNIDQKLNEGKEIVGKKIGLTSKAMQE